MAKVIDVSANQPYVDWAKVKSGGVDGAIFRVIIKSGKSDPTFEYNMMGCEKVGMPVTGVYNYSYATSVAKAKTDAEAVLKALNGRKIPVYMDIEDSCMRGLPNMLDIILAYKSVIEGAGLDFGIYSGLSFYNTELKKYAPKLTDVGFWIARYPSQTPHYIAYTPSQSYQPKISNILVGWQYSSKLQIEGINGNVDISDWYYPVSQYGGIVKQENPYPMPTRLIKRTLIMQHGDDVKWVQWNLVRKGYLPATNAKGKTNVDGWYGDQTAEAVKKLQKDANIGVDGIVGAATRPVLMRG